MESVLMNKSEDLGSPKSELSNQQVRGHLWPPSSNQLYGLSPVA